MDTVELFNQAEVALRDATRALRDLYNALEEEHAGVSITNALTATASNDVDALREACEEGVTLVVEHRTLVMGG